MTTANKITVMRILLVPFFIWQVICYARTGQAGYRWGALLAFALAASMDGLDGYVARHYNQRSDLGAILDPLADKLLLTSALVLFSLETHRYLEAIPIWLLAVVLCRDCLILIGMVTIRRKVGKVKIQARKVGKTSTVLVMATVLWILLGWDSRALPWLTLGAGLTTALSALFYILDGVRQFYSHPVHGPMPTRD